MWRCAVLQPSFTCLSHRAVESALNPEWFNVQNDGASQCCSWHRGLWILVCVCVCFSATKPVVLFSRRKVQCWQLFSDKSSVWMRSGLSVPRFCWLRIFFKMLFFNNLLQIFLLRSEGLREDKLYSSSVSFFGLAMAKLRWYPYLQNWSSRWFRWWISLDSTLDA